MSDVLIAMDWPTEVTLEFLKLYELEPVIWNPKDANHKNRMAVQEAWMRIQQTLSVSCTIPNLKRKKDSLMATFRPMINKYKESRKPGTNPDDAYTPTWFAFETMARFLHPFYNPKTTTNGEDSIMGSDESEENADEGNDEHKDPLLTKEEENGETLLGKALKKYATVDNNVTHTVPDRVSRKRGISFTLKNDNRIDVLNKVGKIGPESSHKDECSLYADLLTARLRAFDEQTRDIVMHEIDNLVFKVKMKRLLHSPQSSIGENNKSGVSFLATKMAVRMVQKRFMSSGLQKFCYNLSGFNKYGLMRDDLLHEDDDVKEALRRLPENIIDERNYRIIRAVQLSIQKIFLPKEEWMTLEKDTLYLTPIVNQVIKERQERENWEKTH
ncbi:hypothetical protein FQR65_LT10925 [Abscondita terminalis]|nr:hypothetical protein FQR65_LT10925 [Abscondita terminalis]